MYSYHSRLFPIESALRIGLLQAIENLGYPAEVTQQLYLEKKLAQSGGLHLQAEIMDMYLESCAPLKDSQRYLSAKQLRPSFYSKNRVGLTVSWQLFDNSREAPLFQTQTTGYYDNWKSNASSAKVIERAFNTAAINLFSDSAFVQQVAQMPTSGDMPLPAAARPPATQQEQGLLSKISGFFQVPDGSSISGTMVGNFSQKAKLSQVLAELTTVKMGATEYYMQHNKWPIKEEIGLNDAMFAQHNLISDLIIKYDGTIQAQLREDSFGPGRKLLLTPNTPAFESGNTLNLNWQCYSNLPAAQNPGNCSSL